MDLIGAVRILQTVAELGSFSAAARDLGLSVSSVARQMDGLETQVGAVLLARSTRRVALTPKGRAFLAEAWRAQETFEAAVARVRDAGVEPAGVLRITAAPSVGRGILPRALEAFSETYPDIAFDLVLTDAVMDLAEAGIDVAVRVGDPAADDALIVRELRPMRRVVSASGDYLDRHGRPAVPQDLSAHSCLLFRPPQDSPSWLPKSDDWHFRTDDAIESVRVTGKIASSDADALVSAACANLGIVAVPDWMVAAELGTGRLEALLTGYRLGPRKDRKSLHLAYQTRDRQSARISAFVAHLESWFGGRMTGLP